MSETKNEKHASPKSGAQLTLGFPPAAEESSVNERVRKARLKLRDKALPNRLVIASLLCDSVVIAYALIFSFWFRFQTPIQEFGVPADLTIRNYVGYIIFGTIALVVTLTNCALYERHALLRFRFVSLQIVKATTLWSLGFLGVALIFKFSPPISRIFVAIAAILVPASLLLWRVIFHRFLKRSSVAESLRQRVLFVGWNEAAERLTDAFLRDPGCAYEVVGCISAAHAKYRSKPSVRTLGASAGLADLLQRESVDMVVLTQVNGERDEIVGLANTCEREMVQFKVIPSYFQILVSGLHLETVGGIPVLGVSRLPLDRFVNIVIKRLVDVVGAVVGLTLSAPLIAIFGALVYWESPGAIFYRTRRLGHHGMEFDIWKIRSMRPDAEKEAAGHWTMKDDPRRLKIGAFMRKWNIDEVPQFWNVLVGDMSLVGPRPESVELIRSFKHEIPHYNARHNAKPGITGWAQIKGLRGDTDLTERIKCDLWYLENWNLFLDFHIMFMTFLRKENAA